MFLIVFNGINCYEVSTRIFIISWKCVRNKESICYEDFWIWEAKVPLMDKVPTRFSKSHIKGISYTFTMDSLMYSMLCARPDICFVVRVVSRY